MVRSPFFQVIRGAKDNERRMAALGYPVFRYQLAAFVLSGMLAGLAGVLLANATGFVGPAYIEWVRSGELIVMVVLGGMGTVIGPVLGAAALLLLEEFIPLALDAVRAGLRASTGGSCSDRCCSRSCWSRARACSGCCGDDRRRRCSPARGLSKRFGGVVATDQPRPRGRRQARRTR